MSYRQFMAVMLILVAGIVVLSLKFELAPWATGLIVAAVMLGMVTLLRRKQLQTAQAPAQEPYPELEERVRAACARVGRPEAALTVVSGGGRAFFAVRNGQVTVSPLLGELMTDPELDALLLQEFAAPPHVARQVWLEILSVPAAIFMVLAVLSWTFTLSLYGLGFLLAIIWTVIAAQFGWANRRTARRIGQAYLDRGGDSAALVSAMIKLFNDGIRHGIASGAVNEVTRAQLAGQYHNHLLLLAGMGGISRERLAEIGSATGAIPELYAPNRLPAANRVLPYIWVIFFGGLLIMLVGSVFVAMLLGGGR